MAERIDLFNPHLGLDKVLPPLTNDHLAEVSELKTPELKPSGLDSLFQPSNLSTAVLSSLSFKLKDLELLNKNVMQEELESLKKELSLSRDPAARRFLKDVLEPMLANDEVLSSYLLNSMRV